MQELHSCVSEYSAFKSVVLSLTFYHASPGVSYLEMQQRAANVLFSQRPPHCVIFLMLLWFLCVKMRSVHSRPRPTIWEAACLFDEPARMRMGESVIRRSSESRCQLDIRERHRKKQHWPGETLKFVLEQRLYEFGFASYLYRGILI